tara:strand:- start:9 stop:176 length:168 start_codon:yes stop_codon:yes gene_type:complete
MPNYKILLESDECVQLIKIDGAKSVEKAIRAIRKHYPFTRWRIVNIAEDLSQIRS